MYSVTFLRPFGRPHSFLTLRPYVSSSINNFLIMFYALRTKFYRFLNIRAWSTISSCLTRSSLAAAACLLQSLLSQIPTVGESSGTFSASAISLRSDSAALCFSGCAFESSVAHSVFLLQHLDRLQTVPIVERCCQVLRVW